MIAVLGEKGRVVFWNQGAEMITGYPPNDVLGSNAVWRDLYPEKAYRDSITLQIAGILKTKNSFKNFETNIRTRLGESRIILWNTRKIPGAGPARTIAVGIDVTTEREAMAFRDSIIENANLLIAVLDPDGTVRIWNKAAVAITGYSPIEVIGRRDIWKKLYPVPEYRREITDRITRIIAEQNYLEDIETTIRTKGGESRVISWNTRQAGSKGTYHEIAIGRDVTRRHKAEEAMASLMDGMTVRLKEPAGMMRSRLLESARLMKEGKISTGEIIAMLESQARNAEHIETTIRELQSAIAGMDR